MADELTPTNITLEYLDYFGNPVPYGEAGGVVDIGAHEYQGTPERPQADTEYLEALADLAQSYDESLFVPAGWETLESAVKAARTVLSSSNPLPARVESAEKQLEAAVAGLEKLSDKVENTPDTAENILAAYHPEMITPALKRELRETGEAGRARYPTARSRSTPARPA